MYIFLHGVRQSDVQYTVHEAISTSTQFVPDSVIYWVLGVTHVQWKNVGRVMQLGYRGGALLWIYILYTYM